MAIYFVRHGESLANEQNRFAGRIDTPLTTLGVRQAHQAGDRIAALGIRFDEVHVSPLRRARETADAITGHLDDAPLLFVADALVERDFGVFSGRSKSLAKKAIGYHGYTEFFHSHSGYPPGGEPWPAMYDRALAYYREVLAPASRNGRNLLVVTHKYIVEMFAMIAAGAAPDRYRDLKVPNATPLDPAALRAIVQAPAARKLVNDLGEHVEIRLPALVFGAAVLGVCAQLAVGVQVGSGVFAGVVAALLGVNTFVGMLRVDFAMVRGRSAVAAARLLTAGRVVLGAALFLLGGNDFLQLFALFLLLPPALLAPTLSLQWGGNYFTAVRQTVVAAFGLAVVLLVVLLVARDLPGLWSAVGGYCLVLTGALVVPTVAAQRFRRRDPIRSGALSTNWGWLGGAALVPLAGFATFGLTPSHIGADIGPALPWIGIAAYCSVGVLVVMRLVSSAVIGNRTLPPGLARDTYITQNTPNVFLWTTLAAAIAPATTWASVPAGLIATLAFFGVLVADEVLFVRRHRARLRTGIAALPFAFSSGVPICAVR